MTTSTRIHLKSSFAAAVAALFVAVSLAAGADPTTQPQIQTPSRQQSSSSSNTDNNNNGNGRGNYYRQGFRNRDRGNGNSNGRDRDNNSGSSSSATGEGYNEKYSILAEQNIFLRDRTRYTRSGPTTQAAPATPEQLLTLTGVVFEDGQYRAYIEDLHTGRVQRLSEGEPVARGRISQIDIDAIEYETGNGDSQHTWVKVGADLTGKAADLSIAGDSDTGPKLDPNDPNLTPEQRLKARRQQLMGR